MLARIHGLGQVSADHNLDNVHVVPTAALGDRIGAVPPHREHEVKQALGHALGWAELKVL